MPKNKTPKKSWKSSDYEKELKQDIKKLWKKNNKENKNGMVSKNYWILFGEKEELEISGDTV